MTLADQTDSNDKLTVEILIGGNFDWSLITHKSIEAEFGLQAVKTKLGWVVSGGIVMTRNTPMSRASTKILQTVQVLSAGVEAVEENLDK